MTAAPQAPRESPADWYRKRLADLTDRTAALEIELGRWSRLRGWAFVIGVVPLLALETSPRSWWPALLSVAVIGTGAFIVFLVRHRRTKGRLRRAETLRDLHAEGPARLAREFNRLPLPDLGPVPDGHPWGNDLDVVGRGSLGHLLGTVHTAPGRAALRQALLRPRARPPSDPIEWLRALDSGSEWDIPGDDTDPTWNQTREARQEAVQELSGHPDFLHEIRLAARQGDRPEPPARLAPFLAWARAPGWSRDRNWAVPTARILAVLNTGLLAAWIGGWVTTPFWVIGVLAALALHRRISTEAGPRFDAAEGADRALDAWASLLETAAGIPGEAPALSELRSRLGHGSVDAAHALRALRRISDWAAVRRSGLTHFPLVALFAWDVHHLHRLERWRARWGEHVDEWVRTLGEVELLAALSILRFDHPEWAFGQAADAGQDGVRARALRHPLLAPDVAVPNDVELPEPGGLLLVTGSNMSGKSTLLRALGANQLLFLVGAPVAARSLETPPIEPFTAMRVRDSLSEGVSFFLAELHRLRDLVETARARPTLVLLDEILQGTNTAERRIAARIVLGHLIRAGAVGAVSTHDLTLGSEPAVAPHLTQVHLREDVREKDGHRTLHFDHKLRAGPATSKNALVLLDIVGLGE